MHQTFQPFLPDFFPDTLRQVFYILIRSFLQPFQHCLQHITQRCRLLAVGNLLYILKIYRFVSNRKAVLSKLLDFYLSVLFLKPARAQEPFYTSNAVVLL